MSAQDRSDRETDMDRSHRSDSEGEERLQDRFVQELLDRTMTIAERWHGQLKEHLRIRPGDVFPTGRLLDHMPGVIRWVIESVQKDDVVDPASVHSVEEVARHWRDSGYSVEESLMHIRVLNRIVHEEIRRISPGMVPPPRPGMTSLLGERMSHGIMLLQVVLVGAYRDQEERRLDDLAGMLVHEVRDPLGAALTGLQLIQMLEEEGPGEGDVESRRQQVLEGVTHSLVHANRMMASMQPLVRAAAASIPEGEPESLRDIVSEVLGYLGNETDSVELRAEDDIPAILVPAGAVRLALHNLVQNAIRNADLEKSNPHVRVDFEYEDEAEQWLLCVEDNGVGIPEGEQQDIFRRFHRGGALAARVLGSDSASSGRRPLRSGERSKSRAPRASGRPSRSPSLSGRPQLIRGHEPRGGGALPERA